MRTFIAGASEDPRMHLRPLMALVIVASIACTSCSGKNGENASAAGDRPAAAGNPTGPRANTDGDFSRASADDFIRLKVPRTFDLSHVEVANFADALGKDPNKAFEFVRDHIAFEPYSGSLRGPRGTLLALAGNSIDQASLLAALLQESGLQVRFVRGTLPDDMATRLIDSLWIERQRPVSIEPKDSAEPGEIGDRLVTAVKRDGAALRESLQRLEVGMRTEKPITTDALLKETREHFWIEWWKDGSWVAMDPSFPSSVPGEAFAAPVETFESLPESLFHRIEVRVRVEEYADDTPASRELLKYSARAADLSGVDLLLVHAPADPGNNGKSQVQPIMIARKERIDGAPFFLEPPRGNAAGGLADALGGGGDEVTVPLASAEYIDFDVVGPNGHSETVSRELFDLVGKKRRLHRETLDSEGVLAASAVITPDDFISTTYDILVTTGGIDARHVQNLSPQSPPQDVDRIDVGAALRRMNIAYSVASDALTSRMAGPSGPVARNYLASPRVQIAELATRGDAIRIGLDLRRDVARTAVAGSNGATSFDAQVLRGIVDGTLERLVVEHFGQFKDGKPWAGGNVVSTSSLLERANADGVPLVALRKEDAILDPSLPANTRARIQESLSLGKVLLAPKKPILISGRQRYAWWQVDPGSGETVAVTDEGLHGIVELSIIRYPYGIIVVVYLPQTRHVVTNVRFASPEAAELFCASLVTRLAGVARVFWGWVEH